MGIPYDAFAEAFLQKVTEYSFLQLGDYERGHMVDGYMKRALAEFKKNCKYDFATTADDVVREFDVEVEPGDLEEIIDIVSDGMVVQWLKPYTYRQDNLESVLNTRDFTTYSPAELLKQVRDAYNDARKQFINEIREYSFNNGDLADLHI